MITTRRESLGHVVLLYIDENFGVSGDHKVIPQQQEEMPDLDGAEVFEEFPLPTWKEYFMDIYHEITIERMKEYMRWFLDIGTVSISISVNHDLNLELFFLKKNSLPLAQFDDVMMLMTLFVLFADDIKILSAPKSVGVTDFPPHIIIVKFV